MSNGQEVNTRPKAHRSGVPLLSLTGPPARADVLRLVANGEFILGVAQKMGISDSVIHAWRAVEKRTKGSEKSVSTLEDEVEMLRRQLRQTKMDRMAEATRHFKKSCRHFQSRRGTANDMRLTYHFIQQQEPEFPVRLLCNTLEVSKSSYYQYRAGASFQPSQADQQMSNQTQSMFWENRRRYGNRQIQKALQEQGIDVGRHQVRRLMQLQD